MPTKANKNSIKKIFKDSRLKEVIISVLVGIVSFIIGSSIISFIMYFTKTDYKFFYYLSYFFISFGSFITARVLYKRISGRGIFIGILGALPYFVLIAIISAVILRSVISPNTLIIALLALLGGVLGGITAANK